MTWAKTIMPYLKSGKTATYDVVGGLFQAPGFPYDRAYAVHDQIMPSCVVNDWGARVCASAGNGSVSQTQIGNISSKLILTQTGVNPAWGEHGALDPTWTHHGGGGAVQTRNIMTEQRPVQETVGLQSLPDHKLASDATTTISRHGLTGQCHDSAIQVVQT